MGNDAGISTEPLEHLLVLYLPVDCLTIDAYRADMGKRNAPEQRLNLLVVAWLSWAKPVTLYHIVSESRQRLSGTGMLQ